MRFCREASDKFTDGNFLICARTDAKSVYGLEETIERSKRYIDSGAHMIFPEGLESKEEFARVAKELREYNAEVLLLANMTEFGKTPYLDINEFKDMGYNIVIYPVSTLRIANKAVFEFL